MGEIRIQVGPITSSITIDDTKAQEILEDYALAYKLNINGTPQQRLDLILRHIASHIQEAANSSRMVTEINTKRDEVMQQLRERKLGNN